MELSQPLVWMTEEEAAAYLRYAPRSLQQWRKDGCIIMKRGQETAPPYYRRAGKIVYERNDLDSWLLGGRITGRAGGKR